MAEYLFEQQPQSYQDGELPNLHWESQDALLTEIPPCPEMEDHWGINTVDIRNNSAVKIHFATGLEDGSLEEALIRKGAVPADETFNIVRFIGPGVGFKGLAWSIECVVKNCVEFDIEVVRVTCATGDEETVQKVTDLKAYEGVWAKQDWLAKPEGVEGGQVFLLKLKFTKLPYKDKDGNQYWGDACNPVPCLGIDIHALTEDTCMRRTIRGCGNPGDCCSDIPDGKCEQQTITKNC